MESKDLLLVDSACALCNKSVNFIIRNGGENKYRFVSLYSEEGKHYLKKHNLPKDYNKSLILISNEHVYVKSEAVLLVCKNLKGLYPLLYGLKIIPRFIRDAFYNLVAKHRHKI